MDESIQKQDLRVAIQQLAARLSDVVCDQDLLNRDVFLQTAAWTDQEIVVTCEKPEKYGVCAATRLRQFGWLANSEGVRRSPQERAGIGAIRQEKTPTENGWGFEGFTLDVLVESAGIEPASASPLQAVLHA